MKMLHHLKSLSATVSLAGLLALSPAYAADLIIGSSTEPSALDPHFSRTGNNQNVAAQIFDRLIDAGSEPTGDACSRGVLAQCRSDHVAHQAARPASPSRTVLR